MLQPNSWRSVERGSCPSVVRMGSSDPSSCRQQAHRSRPSSLDTSVAKSEIQARFNADQENSERVLSLRGGTATLPRIGTSVRGYGTRSSSALKTTGRFIGRARTPMAVGRAQPSPRERHVGALARLLG